MRCRHENLFLRKANGGGRFKREGFLIRYFPRGLVRFCLQRRNAMQEQLGKQEDNSQEDRDTNLRTSSICEITPPVWKLICSPSPNSTRQSQCAKTLVVRLRCSISPKEQTMHVNFQSAKCGTRKVLRLMSLARAVLAVEFPHDSPLACVSAFWKLCVQCWKPTSLIEVQVYVYVLARGRPTSKLSVHLHPLVAPKVS